MLASDVKRVIRGTGSYDNIKYGNTVSSSIPIALADMLTKEKPQNPLVMSIGFGVGLSWGGCLIDISNT